MTFDAKWYSLLHTGTPSDVAYYMAAAVSAASVLELGCGNGRVTIPIAKSGIPIVGVDLSQGMLALLDEKKRRLAAPVRERVTAVQGDMREIDLGRHFDLVIIPYNGLLCLLDDDAVTRALRVAAKHLSENGALIFDIYDVPMEAEEEDSPNTGEPDEVDEEDFAALSTIRRKGQTIQIYERALPHPDPRRFDTAYRYVTTDENGPEQVLSEYTIFQRCLYKEELPGLLGTAGFALTSMTGDFVDAPISEETRQLVVRAGLTRPRKRPRGSRSSSSRV